MAAGLPGEQVDGNDVIAVREATSRALNRARQGNGGTLIECISYRLGDHTTADDATRYREDGEVSRHWKFEPLIRLRNHLAAEHGWSKQDEETLLRNSRTDVDEAAERYLKIPRQPARAMFDTLYSEIPPDLETLAQGMTDD